MTITARLLSTGALAGLVAIAACSSGSYGTPPCGAYTTQCGTVCENYCDGWGCRPYCYESCWDTCTGGTGGSPGRPQDAGADADAGSVLCAPCGSHADCGEGNKCLALGDAGEGACGVACGAAGECPDRYECVTVEGSKQCVPQSRVCEAPKPPPVPQCGPDRACLPGFQCVDTRCAQTCTSTSSCGTGEVCVGKQYCAPYSGKACTNDGVCGAGERCAPNAVSGGTCAPICLDSRDCPKGWSCGVSGLCQAPRGGSGGGGTGGSSTGGPADGGSAPDAGDGG